VSSNYENTAKTMAADLTTNYEANTSLAEKIKNVSEVSEHNFEGGANSELDNDTDGSNLKSSKLGSFVKYPVSVIGFYWV